MDLLSNRGSSVILYALESLSVSRSKTGESRSNGGLVGRFGFTEKGAEPPNRTDTSPMLWRGTEVVGLALFQAKRFACSRYGIAVEDGVDLLHDVR